MQILATVILTTLSVILGVAVMEALGFPALAWFTAASDFATGVMLAVKGSVVP